MHTELQSIMKQAHMLSKISLLAFAVLAFLSGCSSEPTSTIEIPSGSTTSISINGNQFQVRDGNVTYNGQKISVPENSTLKITHNNKSVFIYADDKLVHEE
jgi:uncharacterized lipoprotein YajG